LFDSKLFTHKFKKFSAMKATTKYLFLSGIIAITLTENYAQNSTICFENMRVLNHLNSVRNAEQHARDVIQNNEFERKNVANESTIPYNPLVLNGETLDYRTFDLNSRGFLTLVKEVHETGAAKSTIVRASIINAMPEKAKIVVLKPILFSVSIRRNGVIVEDKKMNFFNKKLYKVNLSDVFPFSKPGDVLIINPVNPEDWKAKRILKLLNQGC
jgi:hypothetical protein